jgi:hypothetical protein
MSSCLEGGAFKRSLMLKWSIFRWATLIANNMRNIFSFIRFFLNWTPKEQWLLLVGLLKMSSCLEGARCFSVLYKKICKCLWSKYSKLGDFLYRTLFHHDFCVWVCTLQALWSFGESALLKIIILRWVSSFFSDHRSSLSLVMSVLLTSISMP